MCGQVLRLQLYRAGDRLFCLWRFRFRIEPPASSLVLTRRSDLFSSQYYVIYAIGIMPKPDPVYCILVGSGTALAGNAAAQT